MRRAGDCAQGWENDEERHVPGSIDAVVLAELRAAAAAAADEPVG